jgi:hypothetical protein
VIEARPVFETADFGEALTPALCATQEERRAKLEGSGKH